MKERKKLITWLLISVFLMTLVLTGCGSQRDATQNNTAQKGGTTYISIGTAKVGGTWYPMGAGIAEVLNKHVPGVNATAEETNGAVANVQLINDGKAEIGFTMPSTAFDSYTGAGNFKDKQNQVMGWFSIEDVYQTTIVLKDSGIKSPMDLKGKKIGIGQPGSANFIDGKLWLEAHGVQMSEVTPHYLSQAEMGEALKNGQISAFLWCTGYPSASIQELALSRDVTFLPTSQDAIKKIQQEFPYYYLGKIPAGVYKGVDKDLETLSYRRILVVKKDLSEDLVYNMTKAVFEHLDYLGTVHPIFKSLSLDNALDSMSVPLHPGALKYFKEKGAKGLDELIAKTKDLSPKK